MVGRILLAEPFDDSRDVATALEQAGCEVIVGRPEMHPPAYTEDELLGMCKDCHILISIIRDSCTRRVMEGAAKLRAIVKFVIGVDNIDVKAATNLGILVVNTPTEAIFRAVAEHSVALMLALSKRLKEADKITRRGAWHSYRRRIETNPLFLGSEKVVGILGLGRIGSTVSTLLQNWNVKLISYDPYVLDEKFRKLHVARVSFETLLTESDFLLVLTPLTSQTKHMIGERELKMMKRSSYLINTARGDVIEESALIRALKERWIEGAGLDVYADERTKMWTKGSPLYEMDNVMLTPHTAGRNIETLRESKAIVISNCLKILQGETPTNIVNPEALPKWKERFLQPA